MKKTLLLSVVLASLLAACGGGDDTPATPPATTEVPATASQSVTGFMSYLKDLVASAADAFEPVDVSAVTPPVSDTEEPGIVD